MQIKNTFVNLIIFLVLGLVLKFSPLAAKSAYVMTFHFVSAIFVAGGLLISMCFFFKVKWSERLKDLAPLWEALSLRWGFFFLPFLFIGEEIFEWNSFHGHKAIYYNLFFLGARAIIYLLGSIFASKVNRKNPSLAMAIFFVVGTFLAFDTGMVLEKEWVSNIYPLIYLSSGGLGFMSLILLRSFKEDEDPGARRDFMRVMITLTAIWGYLHYSQFLILWMGNKPQEVTWYLNRSFNTVPVAAIIILVLKMLPVFSIGIIDDLKKNRTLIKLAAGASLVGYLLEMNFLMAPPLEQTILRSFFFSGTLVLIMSMLLLRWARRYA